MATNEFLPFATGGGANVATQSEYVAASSTTDGYVTGLANSKLMSKAQRQASFIAAAFAQYMCNLLGVNIMDDGVMSNMLAHISAAFGNIAGGAAGEVPYQTAANTTAFSAAPTTPGQALVWDGTVWAPGNGNGDVVHWNDAGVSGANATGTGWLVGGNGINEQWVNLSVTAAGDGPNVTVTYPNATLFATTAFVDGLVVTDPSRAGGGPGDSLLYGVVSQSLTGCVVYLGENGGGTRDVTIQLRVKGK